MSFAEPATSRFALRDELLSLLPPGAPTALNVEHDALVEELERLAGECTWLEEEPQKTFFEMKVRPLGTRVAPTSWRHTLRSPLATVRRPES